ncbi:MAG: hypothetical protein ACRD6B_15870 [Bryobacteraceae bacterium]
MSVQSDTTNLRSEQLDHVRHVVQRQLASLAELCADEIATQLVESGVRGRRGSGYHCPLAVALQRDLPASAVGVDVWVTPDSVWLDTGLGWRAVGADLPETVGDFVDLPETVGDFVAAFDAGRYPQLLPACSIVGCGCASS